MRRCLVSNLKPGMILGQHLHGYYGGKRTLLLGAGGELSSPIIQKLTDLGYTIVFVEEKGAEDVIPGSLLSEETQDMALTAISRFYEQMKDEVHRLVQTGKVVMPVKGSTEIPITIPAHSELRKSVKSIIHDLFLFGKIEGYEPIVGMSRSNALHSHVLSVAILSLLIGAEYGYVDSELGTLAMGALLHDIGKTALPPIYERQFWELDTDMIDMWKTHPQIGEKLLARGRTLTEAERQIVLQHHERQDGTGFPLRLEGDNTEPYRTQYVRPRHIFRFAEIVSAADAFDNLISGGYYGQRFSPVDAVEELRRESGSGWNSSIIRTLSSLVTYFPAGANVRIERHPDERLIGSVGVVARADGVRDKSVEVIVLQDASGRRLKPVRIHLDLEEPVQYGLRFLD